MSELLVIRSVPEAPAMADWVVVDDQGALLEPGGREALSQLPTRAANRRVVMLLPALDVLITPVDLPVRGKQKILQALPFAMEEQLADNVEELHFAAGDRTDDDRLQVAVVRRDLMDGWRELLADAGLDVNAASSEAQGLDLIPGTAVLLIEPTVASLRSPDGELASTDLDGLETLLELWLARSGGDEEATQPHLLVYTVGDGLSAEIEATLESLRPRVQSLEIRGLGESALPRLAANLAVRPGINLLQSGYARRSNLGRYWPAWRAAAVLLAAVLVAAVASIAAETWRLGQRAEVLSQTVEQAMRYTFPGMRVGGDPRAQLQSRLRALGGDQTSGTDGEFLDALQKVARAVKSASGTRLEGVDYRSGILELRLRAPNVEVLDKIQRDIAAAGGLTAEIQSANAEDDGVLGRLRIETAGA
jgi:general secretion pathway protein L